MQRMEVPGLFKIDCFNHYGHLESSFDLKESYDNSYNFQIKVYNNSLWVSQHKLINRINPTEKSDRTFLRKFSLDGRLLSTFIINDCVEYFCIDLLDCFYSYRWGCHHMRKYKLETFKSNAQYPEIIDQPTQSLCTDIRYVYRMYWDAVWNSLIVFANWDAQDYDHRCNIYEISMQEGKFRKIFTVDHKDHHYYKQTSLLWNNDKIIVASTHKILCLT
jgi:hypothetical protein